MWHRILAIAVLIGLVHSNALATNAKLGSDISSSIAQNLLGAPPLPSLEGGSLTLSPQYGWLQVDAVGSYTINGEPYEFTGKAKGNTYGLSFSGSSKGGWGFFIFAGYSRITGDIQSGSSAGVQGDGILDIKAESYAGAAAISYRLIGTEKSTFAMGIFTGPGYIGVKSSGIYDAHPPGGGAPGQAKYTFNPKAVGVYSGLQFAWRLGNFLINPYVTFFGSSADLCQPMDYETISGSINDSYFQCYGGHMKKLAMDAMFASLGLFLGYKTFRISVLSATSTPENLNIKNTSVSIGIPF